MRSQRQRVPSERLVAASTRLHVQEFPRNDVASPVATTVGPGSIEILVCLRCEALREIDIPGRIETIARRALSRVPGPEEASFGRYALA